MLQSTLSFRRSCNSNTWQNEWGFVQ